MDNEIHEFIKLLGTSKCSILSRQQKRTLRGQAINGDLNGAIKGLMKLIKKAEKEDEE